MIPNTATQGGTSAGPRIWAHSPPCGVSWRSSRRGRWLPFRRPGLTLSRCYNKFIFLILIDYCMWPRQASPTQNNRCSTFVYFFMQHLQYNQWCGSGSAWIRILTESFGSGPRSQPNITQLNQTPENFFSFTFLTSGKFDRNGYATLSPAERCGFFVVVLCFLVCNSIVCHVRLG